MIDHNLIKLLQMRLLVGFLGERSQFAWWPTSFFGDYSLQSLEFISPKTALLAQYHGVVEAARKLHDEHLDVGNYHLFRLPEEVEQDLHAVLQTQPGATLSIDMELKPEMALLALQAMGGARPFAGPGPTAVSSIERLRSSESLSAIADAYFSAFSRNEKAYPYLVR